MTIDKLSVPLLLVATIASAAAGAGVAIGSYKDDVKRNTHDVEKLKEERESHELRLQALELKLDAVVHSLDRIEDKLGTKR
jgi:hypothetical protein